MVYATVTMCGCAYTLNSKFRECIEIVGNPAQITSPNTIFGLRLLFGRMRSRWFGSLTEAYLPVALRSPAYRLFAWQYGANLDEVRYPLDSFRTFNDFFCRPLRDGVRPIADVPKGLVSPVDGEVLRCGTITEPNSRVEQVKGATYAVNAFLGLDPVEARKSAEATVHYVVLNLGVGDYHRVHAPCEATISSGRHFCGEMLSLRSSLLRRVDDVFTVNERVVLSGKWQFGQMHVALVAAMNIGNIFLDFDGRLKTNRLRDVAVHCGGDVSSKLYPYGVALQPGGPLGGFRLGSTVVLVFEAPPGFRWKVDEGARIRVGEALAEVL